MSRQNYLQLETRTTDPRLSTLVALVRIGMRANVIAPELVTKKKPRLRKEPMPHVYSVGKPYNPDRKIWPQYSITFM